MTLQEIKTKNMEGTIWEKMIDSIDDHIHIEYVNADKSIIQGQNECAKACERVAIQAQIDAIKKIFKKYNENLRTTLTEGGFMQSLDSIAVEEIKELEKQLA